MTTKINRAMRCYSNPACATIKDFEEDYRRATSVRRLLNEHRIKGKRLNVKLVVNHLVTTWNVFEPRFAWDHVVDVCGPENHKILNTFLYHLGRTFDFVDVDEELLTLIREELDT